MPTAPNDSDLAAILPGTWNVRSTNLPLWLDRQRTSPRFTFTLLRESPLTLREDVAYETPDNGEKHILGVDRWAHEGFARRGTGLRRLLRGHWSIAGADDASTVLVLRIQKSLSAAAGIEILVRDGVEIDELRSLVARNTEQFGLSAEDFASLTWLDAATPNVPGGPQKPE